MNQLDAYYRALLAYRDALGVRPDCARDARAVADADAVGRLSVTRAACTVDEAWVAAIEKGLIYIEKAIKEERQFIYSNGEVIPIEKVKSVSKDSVEHLARHAELITRVEEGEDLVPDKLYTVERLSDYAVYENRFLYMLLCYLRDFVSIRYQRILELTNCYEGHLQVEKTVVTFSRTLEIRLQLSEERRDDAYLREHNPAKGLIDRMDLILKTILAFLGTPLMESAAKVAMLKPPITKTNVLKMDNNFKGAVALYDYIMAYDGPGYTVEESTVVLDPNREDLAADLAEAELLISFLTYRYGLDLGAELRAAHEREEEARREAELRERAAQLEAMRRRLDRSEEAPEAYILLLERQVRALGKEADRVAAMKEALVAEQCREEALAAEIASLSAIVSSVEEEHRRMEAAHADALGTVEERHRAELAAQRERHAAELADHRHAAEEQQAEIDRLRATCEALREEKTLLAARLMGLRAKKRDITAAEREALAEKEGFDELERELDAFVHFYKSEWTRAKRKIRRDLINLKSIKGQSGDA